jgi:nucleoid-associated protein YgaU
MSICGIDRSARPRPRGRSRASLLLVLGALLLATEAAAAAPAPAGTASEPRIGRHRVQRGDTLAALAEKYYGERSRADLLARINGLQKDKPLRPGQLLRVPFSAAYTVRLGDTASVLAKKWLGGSSRHALLLEMNGLPAKGALPAGAEIELPALLTHTLGRGETLGELARRYYGEAGRAAWIAQCNGLERVDQVKRGQRLQIPLIGALPARRPQAAGSAPAAAAAAAPAVSSPKATGGGKRAEGRPAPAISPAVAPAAEGRDPAVNRAVELYNQGEYTKAASLLDAALESGALRGGERLRALRYRAFCGVATGDRAAAAKAFRELHHAAPEWKPNPIEDSPKIRRWHAEALASRRP